MIPPPPHLVESLKSDPRQAVWLVQRPGEEARTVKAWAVTPALALKWIGFMAQPQRQVRGTRRLQRANIRTPTLARGCRIQWRTGLNVTVEYEYVTGRSLLEVVRAGGPDDPAATARFLGDIVNALLDAGLSHRDLKLQNLILDEGDGAVWIIDTVDIRRRYRAVTQTARMLERLAADIRAERLPVTAQQWGPVVRTVLRGRPRTQRRAILRHLRTLLRRNAINLVIA